MPVLKGCEERSASRERESREGVRVEKECGYRKRVEGVRVEKECE